MRKVKISEKRKKKRAPRPPTKHFQFPFINKLRGKRVLPPPGGGDVGGGDGSISQGEDFEHPGRNFAHSGGYLSTTFNDYIPARGRPIPRYFGQPSTKRLPASDSDSNDEEVSNYFRQRQTNSLTTTFTGPPPSAQSIQSKKDVKLPQLNIQGRSAIPAKPLKTHSGNVSQHSRVTSPPPRPWYSKILDRAVSEGLVTNPHPASPLPKQATTVPHLPSLYPPKQKVSPASFPGRQQPTPVPDSVFKSANGHPPSGVSGQSKSPSGHPPSGVSGQSKSQKSSYPPVLASSGPELTERKLGDDFMSTPRKEPLILEPRATQKSPRPPPERLGAKSPSLGDFISDRSLFAEIRRRSSGGSSETGVQSSTSTFWDSIDTEPKKAEIENYEGGEPLVQGVEPLVQGAEPLVEEKSPEHQSSITKAFISPIVRKSMQARYQAIQPRYTEDPLFWVKPKCEEGLIGPDGHPTSIWPPDPQLYPRSDFVLRNAIKVVRAPSKVPIPKYLDSSSGRVSNWCDSGLARNYIYKPDFGKVPAYLASPPKPLGPLNLAEFDAIMNLRQF